MLKDAPQRITGNELANSCQGKASLISNSRTSAVSREQEPKKRDVCHPEAHEYPQPLNKEHEPCLNSPIPFPHCVLSEQ
jgi:hypothetical protein